MYHLSDILCSYDYITNIVYGIYISFSKTINVMSFFYKIHTESSIKHSIISYS